MPQPLIEKTISTLHDYSHCIHEHLAKTSGPVWYRGCGQFAYSLSPTLYRHPKMKAIGELLDLEREIIARFRHRGIPFHSRTFDDDWDCLFFMQHFGVPTRLLDWSESPYVALFFALTSSQSPNEDAAVWVLDSRAWNGKVLSHIGFQRAALAPGDQELNGYAPSVEIGLMNSAPVALLGSHNSPRIVAQRGVFTIFGKTTQPMEEVYCQNDYPKDCLIKLRLPATERSALLKSLLSIGFTDSVIFPDLDGLANEIKRLFGFKD